jgi:precorrin-3B methylase
MPSPIIESNEPQTISFGEAMKKIAEGSRVTKIEWGDKEIYGFLRAGILHIHNHEGEHKWMISDGDINGTDYIVLENLN